MNCKARIYSDSWGGRACTRPSKRDGYCTQHHPDNVTRRRKESNERVERKWAEQKEARRRAEAERKERDAKAGAWDRLYDMCQHLGPLDKLQMDAILNEERK